MVKYSERAQDKVHKTLHEEKERRLKSVKKVAGRKHAINIGLSETVRTS